MWPLLFVCCYVVMMRVLVPSGRCGRDGVLEVFMAVASDVVQCFVYAFILTYLQASGGVQWWHVHPVVMQGALV